MFKACTAMVLLFIISAGTGLHSAEDAELIAKLMQERVQVNVAYKATYTQDAENDAQRNNEAALGEQWIVFNTLVMSEGSLLMQCQFLKLEYLNEINNAQYDYDYDEGVAEKAAALVKMQAYRAKLEQVQAVLDRLDPPLIDVPAVEETSEAAAQE